MSLKKDTMIPMLIVLRDVLKENIHVDVIDTVVGVSVMTVYMILMVMVILILMKNI